MFRALAVTALATGIALLVAVGLYTFWRVQSGSDADHFNFEIEPSEREQLTGLDAAPELDPLSPGEPGEDASDLESRPVKAAAFASLYPGSRMNPRYWSVPAWAGSLPFGAPGIPAGFLPVSSFDPVAAQAAGAGASRIRIPAIGLDSHIAELDLRDLGDQRAYQTPVNTVGHIPETVNPGQMNNGWYFGHLESLGTGEGSVFRHLPEISDLVRHDAVDIFIETEDAEYMYRVTSTRQVHQDDLELTESEGSEITLCTCWPPRVYDRRVLVSAQLIAVKKQG